MNIFFDLDGTLLDSRKRLYELFKFLVPASSFSFDEYWNMKRENITHREILLEKYSFEEPQIKKFDEEWLNAIETDKWLALDQSYAGADELLKGLKNDFELYLITARQLEEKVNEQVNNFGWKPIFKSIMVTKQVKTKSELIQLAQLDKQEGIIIGDSSDEVNAGKKFGFRTIAIEHGFKNRKYLESYHPDFIVSDLIELKKVLINKM
jgi:phosphoglycolate phosphatase